MANIYVHEPLPVFHSHYGQVANGFLISPLEEPSPTHALSSMRPRCLSILLRLPYRNAEWKAEEESHSRPVLNGKESFARVEWYTA